MPASCPLDIKIRGIGTVDMVHDLRKVAGGSFKQQEVVIVHQAKCVNHRIVPFGGRFKVFKKFFPVPFAFENGFSFIAAGM